MCRAPWRVNLALIWLTHSFYCCRLIVSEFYLDIFLTYRCYSASRCSRLDRCTCSQQHQQVCEFWCRFRRSHTDYSHTRLSQTRVCSHKTFYTKLARGFKFGFGRTNLIYGYERYTMNNKLVPNITYALVMLSHETQRWIKIINTDLSPLCRSKR